MPSDHQTNTPVPFTKTELDWIKHQAQDVGFLETSSLPLAPDPNFPIYEEWIQSNGHGPLGYLAKNLDIRQDPRKLGNNLNTAIVFLHPYPKEWSSRWIARYAWGKDYHHIIKSKLRQLASSFEDNFGSAEEHRICVDTAPMLERSLAERSGLGWIGKNGCLISRRHGSFFFIASWLSSKPLSNNTNVPQKGSFHCGTCTRCIDACPTQAFLKPGLLLAERCLSTMTIENRKTIDPSDFKYIKHQAFGCDICQEVCPWNRKSTPEISSEALPELAELLQLPEQKFRDYFRKTALERAGWAGIRRNFLIIAAQRRDFPTHILTEHLNHPLPVVRETARALLVSREN